MLFLFAENDRHEIYQKMKKIVGKSKKTWYDKLGSILNVFYASASE
jgi:hypothetical protein